MAPTCGSVEVGFTGGGTAGEDDNQPEPDTGSEPPDDGADETGGGAETNGIPLEQVFVWPVCWQANPVITEGWHYSLEEQAIHGNALHKAVDIAAPYGTPVYAMASGWALATFQILPVLSQRGIKIGMGGGLLVVIWHDEPDLYTQYLHLSGLGPGMPYYNPLQGMTNEGFEKWDPNVITRPSYEFVPDAVYVEEGQLIGYVGTSGLAANGEEEPSPFPPMQDSWDEPHVHVQVHGDRDSEGVKNPATIYDVVNLYSYAEDYWEVFEFQYGMISEDPEIQLAPRFPFACDM